MAIRWVAVASAILLLAFPVSAADSLSVAPTRLEVRAPANQTLLTLKSGGGKVNIQIRVFAWTEGTDPSKLKPTDAVVVSPPATRLNGKQEITARILRVAKTAVRGRECYRVLVDQLPVRREKGEVVRLLIRHSVPLCFTP